MTCIGEEVCNKTLRPSDDQEILGQLEMPPDGDKSRLTMGGCVRAEIWAHAFLGRSRLGRALGRKNPGYFWKDSSEKDIILATDWSLETCCDPEQQQRSGLTRRCEACLNNRVRLFVRPWTVARQAPLSMGIFQARKLGWVAISYSRGSWKCA